MNPYRVYVFMSFSFQISDAGSDKLCGVRAKGRHGVRLCTTTAWFRKYAFYLGTRCMPSSYFEVKKISSWSCQILTSKYWSLLSQRKNENFSKTNAKFDFNVVATSQPSRGMRAWTQHSLPPPPAIKSFTKKKWKILKKLPNSTSIWTPDEGWGHEVTTPSHLPLQ